MKATRPLYYLIIAGLFFLLASCGRNEPKEKGSIGFNLAWENPATKQLLASSTTDVCSELSISTISAALWTTDKDGNKVSLTVVKEFNCSDHTGSLSDIPTDKTYNLSLVGRDAAGNFVWSGTVSGVTVAGGQSTDVGTIRMTAYEATPTNVTATPGDGSITLNWSSSGQPDHYYVYISQNANVSTSNFENRYSSSTNSTTVTGLSNGVNYYCIVTAVASNSAESSASTVVSAKPEGGALPVAPTGLTVLPGDTEANFSWDAVPGATGYYLYWSYSPGVNTTNGTKISTIAVSNYFKVTGMNNGTKYYFVVTAIDGAGESGISNEVSVTPLPAVPTGLNVIPGDGEATFNWNAVPGATGYYLYWSHTPGVNTSNGTRIPTMATSNQQTIEGMTNGSTYYFVATAMNGTQESGLSNEVKVITMATPTGLHATAGNTTAQLDWNAVPGATGYYVYYSTTPGVTKSSPKLPTKMTSHSSTITGLQNGKTYYFAVVAVNDTGEGAISAETSVTPIAL